MAAPEAAARQPSIDLRTAARPPFASAYRRLRLGGRSCASSRRVARGRVMEAEERPQAVSPSPERPPSPDSSLWSSEEEQEEEEEPPPAADLSPSQQCYLNVCRRLGAVPSHKCLRQLSEDAVHLCGQELGPNGAFAVASALMNNASVKVLDLNSNNIGPEGAQSIATMLEDNIFIVELRLVENSIGEAGLRSLVDQLADNDYVTTLDLSGNRLEEGCAKHIATLLKTNSTVDTLLLGHNNFREKGAVEIAYGIAANRTVAELDLSWNHIRRDGALAVCDALSVNSAVRRLDLSWNGLHWQGCQALARVLPVNAALHSLDLSCNRIDARSLMQLFRGVRRNSSLRVLKIGKNPITSEGIRDFLKSLEACKESGLEELDVTGLTVDKRTIEMAEAISARRKFRLDFGKILKQDQKEKEEDAFLNEDPMMVLMEFMKIRNMRLVDLFLALDSDGSRSLSHQEFRDGLVAIGVPLSPLCVERLIKKLDRDGDGEVDFSELIGGQREHRRRMKRLAREERFLAWEETELGRINLKLRRLLQRKSAEEWRAGAVRRNRSPRAPSAASSAPTLEPPPDPSGPEPREGK